VRLSALRPAHAQRASFPASPLFPEGRFARIYLIASAIRPLVGFIRALIAHRILPGHRARHARGKNLKLGLDSERSRFQPSTTQDARRNLRRRCIDREGFALPSPPGGATHKGKFANRSRHLRRMERAKLQIERGAPGTIRASELQGSPGRRRHRLSRGVPNEQRAMCAISSG